jgi:hypothetical protein
MELLIEIADKLQSLNRILFVGLGIDVGGLQCLSRLPNLKAITWVLEGRMAVRGEGLPEEAISKAFESFEVKPKVEVIRYVGHDLYRDYVTYGPNASRFPFWM